jgi:site-specific DNA recombinase
LAKTVAYIRVSTEEQQTQGTLENQRDAIRVFASSRGIEVQAWLEEIQSGVDTDRPQFTRLSEGIVDGHYSTVIVAAQDRLSRSPLQTLQFIEHVQEGKANLHIIRENITIREGKAEFASELLINMISVFAKNERETIRLRTMEGKRRHQRAGKWVTGQAPLGYELDRQTKVLKVNNAEADIVRVIFGHRLNGMGTLRIVKYLNSRNGHLYERRYEFKRSRYCNVSQRQRKAGYCRVRHLHQDYQGCPDCVREYEGVDITGTSWSPTLIKKVLKNRVYLGEIKLAEKWMPVGHEPIIDQSTFDAVQNILSEAYRHPYESYPYNPLSGIIHCSCGRRMHVTSSKPRISKTTGKPGKQYWAFTRPGRKVGQCNRENVPVMALRQILFMRINKILRSGKTAAIIEKVYERILRAQDEETPDVEELKRRLNEIDQELKRLVRSYTQATLAGVKEDTLSEMVNQIAVSERQKEDVSAEMRFRETQAATSRDGLNLPSPDELLSRSASLWMSLTLVPSLADEIAGQMFRAFVARVVVKPNQVIMISERFNEQLLEEPLHRLFLAVSRLHQLGASTYDICVDKEDTTY